MSRVLCVLLLTLAAPAVPALEPDGSLARWLDAEVAPALGETLARHPAFAGATFGFSAVVDGVPTTDATVLGEAVARRLRQRLTAVPGVRLAVDAPRPACSIGAAPDHLIGIEIVAEGGGARVAVGVVDVVDGVWVGGIAHDWRGRLAASERAALAARVSGAAPGSAERPLPATATARIAAALVERLRCARPAGLDGRTHVTAAAGDAGDGPVAAALALRSALSVTPLVVLVPRPEAADRVLRLGFADDPGPVRELRVLETDPAGRVRGQLASVFVTAPEARAATPAPAPAPVPGRPATSSPPVVATPAALLGALDHERVRPSGVCEGRDRCVEVTAEVLEPSWLWVLSTRDGAIRPLGCAALPERSEPGRRRWRLPVADLRRDAADAPDAGLYLFATAERGRARALGAVLASAPGACGGAGGAEDTASWLARLAAVLDAPGAPVDWRAVHLSLEGGVLAARHAR
jgi:hypothetical protein